MVDGEGRRGEERDQVQVTVEGAGMGEVPVGGAGAG
jgi:hypothetical protein